MKMKILLFFSLLLLPNSKLLVQEIPDCMCPPLKNPPSGYLVNQDSAIVIDTCGIWYPFSSCDSVYWGNVFSLHGKEAQSRIYAKNTWLIWFDVKAIPLPEASSDSVIEVTWQDIDSLNYPEIKDSLKSIEQVYGTYKLIKVNPQFTEPDIGQSFDVIFENYVNVNELTKKFRDCPFTHCDFLSWLADDYPNNVKENSNKYIISIFPNPATEYIEIRNFNHTVNRMVDGILDIQIFDVYGKQMSNLIPTFSHATDPSREGIGEGVRIDVSDFPEGVYFLRIGDEIMKFAVIK